MSVAAPPKAKNRYLSVSELIEELGGVPADRVRLWPPPGTAREKDILGPQPPGRKLVELINGTLVDKPMGSPESLCAYYLVMAVGTFLDASRLGGFVLLPDGMVRFGAGLVYLPDFSYFCRGRFPNEKFPKAAITSTIPDLTAEVLSVGNTREEIDNKVRNYFAAGVRLVWLIDPRKRTVTVCASFEDRIVLSDVDVLTGGAVLPGFAHPVAWLLDGKPELPLAE